MRAVILAAGRGSRMGTGTDHHPKCCTMLAGKPLIEWQLESLRVAGIEEILVVRGYRSDSIRGDFATIDNSAWAQTNMAASLVCAADWLAQGPTIVSYADIVYHPDHIRALMACNAEAAITADRLWLDLWQMRNENPLEDAETFREEGGLLKEIGGKPKTLAEVTAQYMGLLMFRPAGWERFHGIYWELSQTEQGRLDMTGWLRRALDRLIEVQVIKIDGRWCEVDLETDRDKYQEMVRKVDAGSASWSHDWRWQ